MLFGPINVGFLGSKLHSNSLKIEVYLQICAPVRTNGINPRLTFSLIKTAFALIFSAFIVYVFVPLRLNPRGGRQTGIPVYQVLKRVS